MEKLKCGAAMKHIVFKIDDIEKYLQDYRKNEIAEFSADIKYLRKKDGKKTDNEYLVINTDEPYINEVIDILKKYGHWG